ncbi:MAG: glycosyltransferase family 4 protein [Candidatus Berkelbacteria bacterium]
MSKIKVLEIIGDSSLAGAPRHLLSILENLDTTKYKIACICPPGPLAGEIRNLHRPIDIEVISMNSRSDFRAIGKIRKTIKHLVPDLIHVHGTRAGALGRMAAFGLGIPVIYTEHLWTRNFNLKNRALNYLHHVGGWFFDLFTTQNIAVSEAVKDFMIDNNISYAQKIRVIYNGIEPTKVKANIFTKSDKEIWLGTVGTLIPLKGVQYLIAALPKVRKEFPEVRLEIIGDGPFKRELVGLTKKLKLQKFVKFAGFQADVEKSLAKLDIYVQPSTSESFGLAIVQAMSVGLPIVATRTGGIPELVVENRSGILVEPGQIKELSEAILKLLHDRGLAKKMGEMARRESVVRFNLKDMIKEVEEVYDEVAKNPVFPE